MKRSEDRILTTHVGSLHRPAWLEELRGKTDERRNSDPEYQEQLRKGVDWVVQQQVDLGIDIVNDGEYSKSLWTGYEQERMTGFATRARPPAGGGVGGARDRNAFAEFYADAERFNLLWYVKDMGETWLDRPDMAVCVGDIGYTGQELVNTDIANLQNAIGAASGEVTEGFLAVVAPGSVEPVVPNEHYAGPEEYITAIAEALRVEYRAIADSGLIVQLDDAFMPYVYDMLAMEKEPYLKYAQMMVEAANYALDGIAQDRVRYHVCWGSWNGPHAFDIPLRDIARLVLKINAGAYLIEAGNAAHEHEWQVWQDVRLPDGKILIPGVVSHATNVVEHPELIAQRIVRFADLVGRENVIAGTDCGFRTRCHPQIAWAKLRALGEGAKIASARLWPERAGASVPSQAR
jgi:5-methyltetrahydropteroyltriglutamate--homocysteine methyltransferase